MSPASRLRSKLTVRRVQLDLESPFDRTWCGGDAFRSALFNALSLTFPDGERFFINALRAGLQALPALERRDFEEEINAFAAQEALHRRIHARFNAHLADQGYESHVGSTLFAEVDALEDKDPRHAVAITVAAEQLTAMLAVWVLTHPDLLEDCEPRLREMWQWHLSEELEHRSTATELYRALGGSHRWRLYWHDRFTQRYLYCVARQTVSILSHDRTLWRWSTWRSGARTLFGERGLIRTSVAEWFAARRRDFHPDDVDAAPSEQWFAANEDLFETLLTPRGRRAVVAAGGHR